MSLNPDAVNRLDGENKTLLHLSVESGKEWDNVIERLFAANPVAIQVEDNSERIPLVAALLTYCDGNESKPSIEDSPSLEVDELDSRNTEELQLPAIEDITQIE
jgi:hypothetical protein